MKTYSQLYHNPLQDSQQEPKSEISQTLSQLNTLGYKPGDRIYIRFLPGKGFDPKVDKLYPFDGYITLTGEGFSFTRLHPQSKGGGESFTTLEGHLYLTLQNQKGYGVYLVVNSGGRKDAEITRCPALFYECDDISKEEQWQRIGRLSIEPSLVIETRNSLHVYYSTTEQGVEGWRRLQQRLIQHQDSDASIHNVARLMRLAGFDHQKKGSDPFPVSIVYQSDSIYSRFQFDALLPPWDSKRWGQEREAISEEELKLRLEAAKLRREQQFHSIEIFPLEICLSKADRELIALGAGQGGRNYLGFKLVANLIATEEWLRRAGYQFSGSAEESFNEYCDRCSPPISNREREQIWKSATRSNPTPSLPDNAIENCISAWQWNQLPENEKAARRQRAKEEPDPALYQEYIARTEEEERLSEIEVKENKLEKFADWVKQNLKKLKNKGFGKKDQKENKPNPQPKTIDFDPIKGLPTIEEWEALGSPVIEFEASQRDLINSQIKAVGLAAHDCSPPGTGKTHAVPNLETESGGKIWYLSHDHRNPTVKELEDKFADLNPRSKYGFLRDGEGKLKPANWDTDPSLIEVQGNCDRADLFNRASQLGYNPNLKTGEGGNNPICQTCPKVNFCGLTTGQYRFDRRETLSKTRIRAHLESLPREDYDYSRDSIIVDEPSQQLQPTKAIETNYNQLLIELDRAREFLTTEAYSALGEVIFQFKPLFAEARSKKYGLSSNEILPGLNPPERELLDGIIEVLELNPLELAEIFSEADSVSLAGKDYQKYRDQIKFVNKYFRASAYLESKDLLEKLPPNTLIPILKAIRGDKGFILRLKKFWHEDSQGKEFSSIKLVITCDRRSDYSEIFNQAQSVIFLDSTISTSRLKEISRITRPIFTIREKVEKPLSNLKITAIETRGLKANNPSDTAKARVKFLLETLEATHQTKIPSIGHKALKEELGLDGHWFKNSRGVNTYAGSLFLALVGTPNPNEGSVQDDYVALGGDSDVAFSKNSEVFKAYYKSLVEEEITQAVGRVRASRYPDQEFQIYFIGTELDLSFLKEFGATVEYKDAFEICPQAGTPGQYALYQVLEAISTTGAKTQAAVGEVLGKTPQAIGDSTEKIKSYLGDIAEGKKVPTPTLESISKLLSRKKVPLVDLIYELEKLTKLDTTHPIDSLYRVGCIDDHQYSNNKYLRELFELPPIELAKQIRKVIHDWGWRDFKESFLDSFPELFRIKVLSILIGVVLAESDFLDTA